MKQYQKNITERASRNLSNRADGDDGTIIIQNADPNVDAGIDNFFTYTVTNNAAAPVAMAMTPANFNTERYVIDDGEVIKTWDNIDALRAAGHMVGAVLADGVAQYKSADDTDVNVACFSNDPQRTIKYFLDYIKFNPIRLKHMDIVSSNINQWTGNMSITFINPFYDNVVKRVNLNTFFSRFQYQNDRIGIDFAGSPLEFSDLLLWIMTIPAGATAQFILTF